MITDPTLWSGDEAPGNEDPLRAIRSLFQAIAHQARGRDREDREKFRRNLEKLAGAVESDPSTAELLASTGSALKDLEEYFHSATLDVCEQGAELQSMIVRLTRAVVLLASSSDNSIAQFRTLKLRIERCLESIRGEAQRQKAETCRIVEDLRLYETQGRFGSESSSLPDPVTGLPARADAMAALAKSADGPKPVFVALLAVDRISAINNRFGYAAGDEVLNLYLDSLRTRLHSTDRIFRWSGPAFMVLLERPERLEKVRDEFRYLLPSRAERPIQASHRTPVAISATWTVFPVTAPVEGLIEQLDKFLAGQWNHGK